MTDQVTTGRFVGRGQGVRVLRGGCVPLGEEAADGITP
jgi:hypothetical protein